MAPTPRQKIFADKYLADKELNATKAYRIAYPNCKSDEAAAVNASKLLRSTKVKEYIDKKMKEREKRTEITQDMVLQELAKIGFARITDYVTVEEAGNYRAVKVAATKDIPDSKVGAIASIKEGTAGIEIKMYSKERALELIGRHLGMWKDQTKIDSDEDGVEIINDV